MFGGNGSLGPDAGNVHCRWGETNGSGAPHYDDPVGVSFMYLVMLLSVFSSVTDVVKRDERTSLSVGCLVCYAGELSIRDR